MWIKIATLESKPSEKWQEEFQKLKDDYLKATEGDVDSFPPPKIKLQDSDMVTTKASMLIRESDIEFIQKVDKELVEIVLKNNTVITSTNSLTHIEKQLNIGQHTL